MANVSFQAPTDYSAEAEDIARRRKYAEMLQAQSMQPMEGTQMAGGWAIPQSPLSGLAKMLQAYNARAGMDDATARQRALAERYNTERGAALAAAMRAGAGTPARTIQPDPQEAMQSADFGTPEVPAVQQAAVPPNRQAMIQALMGSRFPDLQQAGMTQALAENKPYVVGKSLMDASGRVIGTDPAYEREMEAARLEKSQQAAAQREQRQAELEARLADQRLAREDRAALQRELQESRAQSARELRALAGAVTPVSTGTIADPNNPNQGLLINTRVYNGGSLGSPGVLGVAPKLTETGKANFKQMTTMQGIGTDLQAAEDLLMGNVRDSEGNVTKGALPTGSGIGAAADFAGSLVGVTLPGAQEADALKVIAGKLVQKVPRFEGPQSDKDVALYKQMAADAGNASNTRARRLAAVKKMREIYSGYEDGSRGRLVQEQLTNPQRRASDVKPATDVFNAADAIINGRR